MFSTKGWKNYEGLNKNIPVYLNSLVLGKMEEKLNIIEIHDFLLKTTKYIQFPS